MEGCDSLGILDILPGRKKEAGVHFKKFTQTDERYSLELPEHWRVVDISSEYGYVFSDEHRQQGVLAVRCLSALFSNVEKYAGDLIAGMQKKNNYKLVSTQKLNVNGMEAVETVFKADAFVNEERANAAIINLIIHYPPRARFFVISYSVLQKDANKYAIIYSRARDSFRVY